MPMLQRAEIEERSFEVPVMNSSECAWSGQPL